MVELRKMYLKKIMEGRQEMSQFLNTSVRSLGEKHFKEMSRLAENTKVQRLHYEDDIKHLNRCVNDISHEYSQRIEVLSQTFSKAISKTYMLQPFS